MLISQHLNHRYLSGKKTVAVLHDINLTIEDGEFVAIVGPSGSGKTTLLGLLAGLDRPTDGYVRLDGDVLSTLSEDERARIRSEKVGFVFQSFHLLPTLTALENIQVPLELHPNGAAESPEDRGRELLALIGLSERGDHYPAQLSGGEQQRVVIARALANRPKLLFADEPTGNLDRANGRHVIELLETANREAGTTIVLVTHDTALAQHANRVIHLEDGRVAREEMT